MQGIETVAQEAVERRFACVVIDAQTGYPLSQATSRVGSMGWSADEAGRVGAIANVGDTILFTHVGYTPAAIAVTDTLWAQNIVAVRLNPDTIPLSEVVVRPRPLYLRESLSLVPIVVDRNDIVAQQNMRRSTYSALTNNSVRQWDSSDNQRNVLGRHLYQQEYRGMIPPDQMIGVSNLSIAAIVAIVQKIVGYDGTLHPVEPLSPEELRLLLED
ncbi:MAG: hypothetical protein HUJ96_06995 [Marinilabiliaceae bacterium]|nr:hypothetical protein [Marinilabiliaceae bacterium]